MKEINANQVILALIILNIFLVVILAMFSVSDGQYKEGYLCRYKYAKYIEPHIDPNYIGWTDKPVPEKCQLVAEWFEKKGLRNSNKLPKILNINNGS